MRRWRVVGASDAFRDRCFVAFLRAFAFGARPQAEDRGHVVVERLDAGVAHVDGEN